MKIYKFKDTIDGKFAFIVAKNQGDAIRVLQDLTSIPFKFIESKNLEELNRPIVLFNSILPF